MRRVRGSFLNPSAISSGDGIGSMFYEGHNGTATIAVHQELVSAIKSFNSSINDIRVDRKMTLSGGGGASSVYQYISNDGGLVHGTPAGGSKGFGTINAQGVYDDGTLLTCYPLEYARTGGVDLNKWDSLVPQRPARVVKRVETTKDKDGVETKKITKEEVPSPVRKNDKARAFLKNADMLLDPESFANFWRTNGHLPAFPSVNSWEQLSIGDISQRLWETVEVQAVHISKLTARISSLEARGIAKGWLAWLTVSPLMASLEFRHD